MVRLVNPTHVIHLHGDNQESRFWFREELAPINTHNYHHSLGWLLTPPNPCDKPRPPDHPCLPNSNDQPHPQTGEASSHVRQSDQIDFPEYSTGSIPNDVVSSTTCVTSVKHSKRKCRRLKLKRLLNRRKTLKTAQPSLSKAKAVNTKFLHRVKLKADLSKGLFKRGKLMHRRCSKASRDTGWKRCGVFQLFSHLTNPHTIQTR